MQSAKYIANICANFCSIFCALQKIPQFFSFIFAICKIYRKYLRYFLRRANNSAKIYIFFPENICGIIWVDKQNANFCVIICASLKILQKIPQFFAEMYTVQKIPQIYPTNIAPYSKYYCTVHIVHFTEGWVGVEGDICDKKNCVVDFVGYFEGEKL